VGLVIDFDHEQSTEVQMKARGMVLVGLLTLSFSSFAEKKSLKVDGMHCKGCVEMVQGEVCEVQKFKTCNVRLNPDKKNQGLIDLETAGDEKIKLDAVKTAITSQGDYTVSSVE